MTELLRACGLSQPQAMELAEALPGAAAVLGVSEKALAIAVGVAFQTGNASVLRRVGIFAETATFPALLDTLRRQNRS